MVELIFFVCMLAQPAKCESIQPSFMEPMAVGTCMRDGPLFAMRWLEAHPDWKLRAWKCAKPSA
jgi:hypothetical protein